MLFRRVGVVDGVDVEVLEQTFSSVGVEWQADFAVR